MAQSNKFRTKRRRLNGVRERINAFRRWYFKGEGLIRADHQSLKSALKADRFRE